jgi:hypothetical protein
MDKKTLTIILMALIIIAGVGYYGIQKVQSTSYNQGLSDGQKSIIAEQTRTASIFYFDVQTNSTQNKALQTICAGVGK